MGIVKPLAIKMQTFGGKNRMEYAFFAAQSGVCYTWHDSSHDGFLIEKERTRSCSMSISIKRCTMLTVSKLKTEPILAGFPASKASGQTNQLNRNAVRNCVRFSKAGYSSTLLITPPYPELMG